MSKTFNIQVTGEDSRRHFFIAEGFHIDDQGILYLLGEEVKPDSGYKLSKIEAVFRNWDWFDVSEVRVPERENAVGHLTCGLTGCSEVAVGTRSISAAEPSFPFCERHLAEYDHGGDQY